MKKMTRKEMNAERKAIAIWAADLTERMKATFSNIDSTTRQIAITRLQEQMRIKSRDEAALRFNELLSAGQKWAEIATTAPDIVRNGLTWEAATLLNDQHTEDYYKMCDIAFW